MHIPAVFVLQNRHHNHNKDNDENDAGCDFDAWVLSLVGEDTDDGSNDYDESHHHSSIVHHSGETLHQ